MDHTETLDKQSIFSKTSVGFYHVFCICFCFIFIISNLAASKVTLVGGIFIDTGTLYFPLLYIINDITTEVYGFKASRKIIWLAVVSNICFVGLLSLCVMLPSAADYDSANTAFNRLFALSPRILVASVSSFLIGEYINSLVLALSKIKLSGRLFMFRAVFSTFIGVSIESFLFALIAFYGMVPNEELVNMSLMLIFAKVFYELISIPLTAKFVTYLKLRENSDYYDYNTKFNILPF